MEEYNEREMARMKKLIILCVILMVASMVPMAAAITVDGIKDPGEWDGNWSYNQTQGVGYVTPALFGDRLVMMQGGFDAPLIPAEWNDNDPQNDGGPQFNDAIAGSNSSGFDIKSISVHVTGDILYGLCEVYGIPGDLDGDGNVSEDVNVGDAAGDIGPAGVGIGPSELWEIKASQGEHAVWITVSNNNWSVTNDIPLSHDKVMAKFNSSSNGVYEIQIDDISVYFNVSLGADPIKIEVRAGGSRHTPGEDTATAFVYLANPAIDIEKSTNGEDADNPIGPVVNMTDSITWEYNITNTGVDPLSNIVVTDNEEGLITPLPATTLDPGQSMTVQVNSTASEYGQYSNIANVTGNFVGIPVYDEDPSHYYVYEPKPEIHIEKHTNGDDADNPKGPKLIMGATVTWEYFVTNTGNVTLTNIIVTDDKEGDITLGTTTLAPSASTYGTAAGTVTEYGQYENEATVTGDYNGGTVNDTDPSHYYCQEMPTVPALTPVGLMGLIGILGIIGIVGVKRRD